MQVGQMYENRNTKKVGVLEEVNEKYKTLLMRDENGDSFNINFSTFKSTWRKYKGDMVIQTSNQVEDSQDELKEVKKVVKKRSTGARMPRDEKYKIINSSYEVVESLGDEFEGRYNFLLSTKGGIQIKIANSKHAEIWIKPHTNTFNVRLPEEYYEPLKDFIGDLEVKFFPNERTWLRYSVRGFALDRLEEVAMRVLEQITELTDEDEQEVEE